MKPSQACIDLIKRFEGFRAEPYVCPAGRLTIGYGTTSGVTKDMRVSEADAETMLRNDLARVEHEVSQLVRAAVTQAQFDALCCFAYNCGTTALKTSTLLRLVNAGDVNGAADEFPRWVHGAGKQLPGLVKRRAAEQALFLGVVEA